MTDTSSQPTSDNATNEQVTSKVEHNGQSEECQGNSSDTNPNHGHAIVAGEKRDFEKKKIFIGDIDASTTADDLKQYFGKYGKITNVDVKNSGKKNKIIRFGFIAFTEHSPVEEILNSQPHTVKDKVVQVKQALIKPALKKICISGLDNSIKEDKIKEYFEKYGKVESIQIPSGDSEYITLTFENEAMAAEATKESEHTIESSKCAVQKAETVKKPKARKKQKYFYHPTSRFGRPEFGRTNYFGKGNSDSFGRFPNFNNRPPGFSRGGPRNPSGYNHFPNDYPPQRYGGGGSGLGFGNRPFGSEPNYGPRPSYGGPSNYGGGPSNYGDVLNYGRRPYSDVPSNYGSQGYNEPGYIDQPYRPDYNNGPSNYGDGANYGGRSGGGYSGNSGYERGSNYPNQANYGGRQNYNDGTRPGGYGDKPRLGNYNQDQSSFGKTRPMRGGIAFHPYEY